MILLHSLIDQYYLLLLWLNDKKDKAEIDFDEDYYLPIGTSPSFSDYKIKINPDKFLKTHFRLNLSR